MKKILLAVTAALAITSCSQNEEFENVGQNAEISFGTIVRNSTRANILTTDNMQTFTVSGYQTDAEMAEAFIIWSPGALHHLQTGCHTAQRLRSTDQRTGK